MHELIIRVKVKFFASLLINKHTSFQILDTLNVKTFKDALAKIIGQATKVK